MIANSLPECPAWVIERAEKMPGEIELSEPFLVCFGGIGAHTDKMYPPWSAFLVVRNDGCRVWGRGGYRGTPRAGERFTLNIHKLHGITAPRRHGLQALIVVYADGRTEYEANRKLDTRLRHLQRKRLVKFHTHS